MKYIRKLKKNYEFNNTFRKGKYFSGNYIECFFVKNNKDINYYGIAISSKLCNAVKRNRIKRVIREAFWKNEKYICKGNTFVFLWKKKVDISECCYKNIYKDMEDILKKIGVYINENNN